MFKLYLEYKETGQQTCTSSCTAMSLLSGLIGLSLSMQKNNSVFYSNKAELKTIKYYSLFSILNLKYILLL